MHRFHLKRFCSDGRFQVWTALWLVAVLFASVGSHGAQTYTLTDLGTLGGGYSRAYGLNNFGQVVGLAPNNTRYQVAVEVCDPNCNPEGHPNCCRWHNEQRDNQGRPFLWTPTAPNETEGSMIDLGAPADKSSYGVATQVSESGRVIGESDTAPYCFAWVPVLPNSSSGSLTNCGGPISVSGQSLALLGLYPDYIYTSRLGTLPGYSNSVPLAANTNGQVVGYCFNHTTNSGMLQTRACLFSFNALSPAGVVTSRIDLGTSSGFTNSVATSINSHGQVVGRSTPDPFACGPICSIPEYYRTFIWDRARGLRELTPLIQGAAGVVVYSVYINDAGQIAGTGWFPTPTHQYPDGGYSHAVLLTPQPAPRLRLAASQPGGQFRFTLEGEAGQNYTVEVSTNLVNWTALTNFVSATGSNQFIDIAAPSFNRRFYRVVTP